MSGEPVRGSLTDHYDPRDKVVRLSMDVYGCDTVAAVGVAAHETGHAIQHAVGYFPLQLRNAIIPITNIGSQLSIPPPSAAAASVEAASLVEVALSEAAEEASLLEAVLPQAAKLSAIVAARTEATTDVRFITISSPFLPNLQVFFW